jgi:hypothetical protein
MDDFESLNNYPNLPEAGTGFIDSIRIHTPNTRLAQKVQARHRKRGNETKIFPSLCGGLLIVYGPSASPRKRCSSNVYQQYRIFRRSWATAPLEVQ